MSSQSSYNADFMKRLQNDVHEFPVLRSFCNFDDVVVTLSLRNLRILLV